MVKPPHMKVNQHQIIAFNAACQHKSFSKAATALGVTQSSVTQNVAKFEATVGAYLFERRRTGLVLTPAGKRLYRVTEEIGILHTLLDERIGEYAQLERGLLRIAGTACNPAMTYMSRFKERYPGVDLTFENASWRECEDALKNREADVVLMPEPESRENLYVWNIEQRFHAALVHTGHPLFERESVTIKELADHQLVVASTRSFARWRLERRAAEMGVIFPRVMMVCSTPMAVEAVQHGLGITVTAQGTTTLAGTVRAIPISDLAEPYELVAVCNRDVRNLSLVNGFFDCMD
jgi:DNA-binding transcriptional LysR family regulator